MVRTQIVSHRGGAFLWPENSLMAFRETLRLAVDQVECDVHLSADGEVVVMHDATLDRTTDATGPVAVQTARELRRVRLKGAHGESVPTLAEVAALFRGREPALRVEIKPDSDGRPYSGIVAKTLGVLEDAGMRDRSEVISLQIPTAVEAARSGRARNVALLLRPRTWRDAGLDQAVSVARAHGISEMGLHESELDTEIAQAVRGAGLALGVWGANHRPTIDRAMRLGAQIITTDDPPLALALASRAAMPEHGKSD